MSKFKIIKSYQKNSDPTLKHIENSSDFLVEFIDGELKKGDRFLLVDAGHKYPVTILNVYFKG